MDSNLKVKFSKEELLEQNQALSEELAQCQSDKDFVWNLWKTLQVEKPDIAGAINSVVEREQVKSDAKDLKVLNVLQKKDQQINELQEIDAELQSQLRQSNERLSDVLVEESNLRNAVITLENEKEELYSQNETIEALLEERTNELEAIIPELKELQNTNSLSSKRNKELTKQIEDLQNENTSCLKKINLFEERLHAHQTETDHLKRQVSEEKKSFHDLNGDLETNLNDLKRELSRKIKEFDELQENLEIYKEQINNYLSTIEQKNETLQRKDAEIHDLRKDMAEKVKLSRHVDDQCQLIKNLEELQDDTQKVLSEQQEKHSKEISLFRKSLTELTKKNANLQNACDNMMEENKQCNKGCQRCLQVEEEVHDVCQKFNWLVQKDGELKGVKDENKCNDKKEIMQRQHDVIKSMERELQTTRSAHSQRLERYKFLKGNHELVLKQLATYEDPSILSPLKKEQQHIQHIQRASQRSLQHEGSQSVWNELEYYKSEYNKMKTERPKLKENLDELKVRVSRDATVISSLKLRLAELKSTLSTNQSEWESCAKINRTTKDEERAVSSKIVGLESQLEIWKGELVAKEIELNQMKEKYTNCLHNEKLKHQEIERLSASIFQMDILKRERIDVCTQTGLDKGAQEVLVSKMNQVMEMVSQQQNTKEGKNEHFTIQQLESIIRNSVAEQVGKERTRTETSPVKRHCNERAIQTEEVTEVNSTEELVNHNKFLSHKKKEKLSRESERLLVMRSELTYENRSLKKRVVSLETQVCQLRDSRHTINKEFQMVQEERDKLKKELVSVLQKLQVSRDLLQGRSQELDHVTNELEFLLKTKKDESSSVVELNNQIKLLRTKMNNSATEHSHSMVRLTTLEHENVLLTQKLTQTQERVVKLEKSLDQKKMYVSELKERHDVLKDKVQSNAHKKDEMETKMKENQKRDQKNKAYLEQLKKKCEQATKEKIQLKGDLRTVQDELIKKSHLLEESQRLCGNAETAITEMEQTAYKQFKLQNERMQSKEQVIKSRYDKSVVKSNEMRLAIVNFAERMLSQIHDKRDQLHKKQEEEKKEQLVNGRAFDVACSILNMSTSDLQEFLKDKDFDNGKQFEENNIRENLQIILQKEKNFAKILTTYLADLVNYNVNMIN